MARQRTKPGRRFARPRTICENGGLRSARRLERPLAPVAQPDRVVASEAIGRGFESLRARQRRQNKTDGCIVRNYDLDFLKRFSMVLAFLAAVTLGLILFSSYLHDLIPPEVSPQAQAREQARIAPVGAVYAGTTGAAAQAAAAAAASAAAASQVAYGGTLDGQVIYNNLCTGCHTTGVANAPTLDAAHWTSRIAQGVDVLHRHAIE